MTGAQKKKIDEYELTQKSHEYESDGVHRRRKLMRTSRWILRKIVSTMTYRDDGCAQKKIDAYKMKGSQKTRVQDDGCTEKS